MEEECLANGVKMPARMIHKVSGETYEVPYGRTKEHFILSISRLRLNQMILTAAEKRENVNLHFNHRITDVDLSGTLKFSDKPDASGDVLIGADGAYSKVRSKMARGVFDFSQTYIPHGYKELVMDKGKKLKMTVFLFPAKFRRSKKLMVIFSASLTLAGKVTNFLSTSISLKMAERSEPKSAKQSFASKI